ncbi:major facilitator superfamily domain-containing protein, partial [Dactylonectria macrodidyma]
MTSTLATLDDNVNRDSSNGFRQSDLPTNPISALTQWSQVLVGLLVNFMTWGNPNAYGVFQLYYSQTTDWSSSQISWIGSTQLFLTFVIGPISGRLADAGYGQHCIMLGSSLSVLGLTMTSLASQYWHVLLAQGLCVGLGGGMMAMPAAAAIGAHLKSRRALAMSVSGCGAGIGAVTYASIVQYSLPKIGFGWAVRCCGLVSLLCALGANILTRSPLYVRKAGGLIDWRAFHNRFFLIFCVGSFFIYFSLFAVMIYINSFATAILSLTPNYSVRFLLLSNAVSIIARPLSGIIADRFWGEVRTWTLLCMLLSVTIFIWIGIKDRTSMYVYSALMGCVNGGAQGLFPSAINSLSMGSNKLGTRLGMVFAICGMASLTGPPAMGALIDAYKGKYLWAQVCGGTIMGLGALTVAISTLFWKSGGKM